MKWKYSGEEQATVTYSYCGEVEAWDDVDSVVYIGHGGVERKVSRVNGYRPEYRFSHVTEEWRDGARSFSRIRGLKLDQDLPAKPGRILKLLAGKREYHLPVNWKEL